MEQARIKNDTYVSYSSPGGGKSRTSDNVVWSRSLVGAAKNAHLVSFLVCFQCFYFSVSCLGKT